MLEVAVQLDRTRIPWDPAKMLSQLRPLDTLQWGRRSRWTGVIVDEDVLVLDFKQMLSFRIHTRNLSRVLYRLKVLRPKTTCSIEYVRQYFEDNCDNPYALWNYYRHTAAGDKPPFTQLPPLAGAKDSAEHSRRIARIYELAQTGDTILTFNRESGLHKYIRKYDRGMFGHCGIVSENKSIYEITLSGGVESQFSELNNPSLDVALYRIPNRTDEQRSAIAGEAAKWVGIRGYGWYKVVRLLLWKRFNIPFNRARHDVSPDDLIYFGKKELIGYA